MTKPFPLRIAAISGWIAFIGVVGGLIVIPTVIAGQPPTANSTLADAVAYFRHRELLGLNAVVAVFVAGLPLVPFGLGLRRIFGEHRGGSAVFADLGFLALLMTVPIYVVSGAIGGALTAVSSDPATFQALHALYQVLYNGAADVLEGAWIGAFSIAALSSPVPRWIGWLGLALAATRWLKAFVPVFAVPEAIIPVSGVLFVAWLLAVVVVVTMRTRSEAPQLALDTVAA